MPQGLRVGVLSPFVGGDYYGALIAAVNAAAVADGGRVVAIQTLDPGSQGADWSGVPDARHAVAWGHLDAAVVLPGAVDAACVRRLRAAGTHVVLLGHDLPDAGCPAVSADNRSGVRDAVAHLVGHGHRRIAFAGLISVSDVRERYEGYRDGLRDAGIEAVPDLFLGAPDNHESGGVVAARQLLAAAGRLGSLPATAVVTGTDRNALGLMEHLTAAGYRLPSDLAVIGFDDIPDARYAQPSLSSVRQPLDRLGALAHDLLRALARTGQAPPASLVPTTFVARDSCGCPPSGLHLSEEQARGQFRDNAFLQMTLNIQYELGIELLRTHERDPRAMGWLGRTPALAGCLGLWPLDGGGRDAVDAEPGAGPADPEDPDPPIEVVGAFRADGGPVTSVGRITPVSAFPPDELFATADGRDGTVVFVVPVRSEIHDWGVLAAVGRIQDSTPPGREMMNHSGALLAVALDHDTVLRSLHEQKERLRRAALYDQLTGLPNRTLLLDRLAQSCHRASRHAERRFALLFLDLDGFKAVNDRLGHAAGDAVLVATARRLTAVLRRTDTAARLGGDEFVVLLDGLGAVDEATVAADRVRAALAEPVDVAGQPVTVGVSIGIAHSGGGSLDPDELLRQADAGMYAAKSASRGERAAAAR